MVMLVSARVGSQDLTWRRGCSSGVVEWVSVPSKEPRSGQGPWGNGVADNAGLQSDDGVVAGPASNPLAQGGVGLDRGLVRVPVAREAHRRGTKPWEWRAREPSSKVRRVSQPARWRPQCPWVRVRHGQSFDAREERSV